MDRRPQLRAEIDLLMRRVPAAYQGWNHGKVVEYKVFAAKVKKAVAKSSTTETQFQSLINEYRSFL
jgi:hypothetical protein